MGNLKDYATSTVLTIPSPATSGTSLVVQTGHGARFPAAPFMATLHPPSELPTLDNAEKVEVTAKSTDTFTILRAQGDTTAKAIEAGWRISNSVFLADIPVVDSTTVNAAGATMNADTTLAGNGYFLDEDAMTSNSDTKVASQQSIKAYVDTAISAAKQALMPVGTIVVLGVSTNPNTLYGFGTWTAIAGKVLVGLDGTQTEFDTLDETGGHKKLQAHTHTRGTMEIASGATGIRHGWNDSSGGGIMMYSQSSGAFYTSRPGGDGYWWAGVTASGGAGTNTQYHTRLNFQASRNWTGATSSAGDGNAENLQPYIVKYMWQRTA